MVQYLCYTRVSETRAVYYTVKTLRSRTGSSSLFLVYQVLDSYWSKTCGIALLIFALFTSLPQRNSNWRLLFVQFRYLVSHSVVRLNSGVFMGLSGRSTQHIMFGGFGAITSSTQENLQACVCWRQGVNLKCDNSLRAVPHMDACSLLDC